MRFDEAFDILVAHCVEVAPSLAAATGHTAISARTNTYGNDIWIPAVVRTYLKDQSALTREDYLPFYDAAWELCRIGVLRPGQNAPMGQGQIGGGGYTADGYSITGFGYEWLADPDRRIAGDPSRLGRSRDRSSSGGSFCS